VKFFFDGLDKAFHLLTHPDAALWQILKVTVQVAVWSTLAALAIGLPLGLLLGLETFRGRRAGLAAANAGLGFPPVFVGIVLALLFFRGAPLGGLHLLYTVQGIVVAQTILALPIVIAFTAAAVHAVPTGLFDQARALGASRARIWALALREARVGVFAAAIGALGAALAEVGAVVLVGGNIYGSTQTLSSALLQEVNAGNYGRAMALGILLIGIIVIIVAILTVAQQRGARAAVGRAS
jgi:tungstate transport system permease protein